MTNARAHVPSDRPTSRPAAALLGAIGALATIGGITGCASPAPIPAQSVVAPKVADFAAPLAPGEMALEPVPPQEWPSFAVPIADRAALLAAIDESLAYYRKPSSRKYYPYLDIDHDRAAASLVAFRALVASGLEGAALDAALRERFDLFRSKGRARTGEVLFTSYCEPIYAASRTKDARFRYPLYRRPEELLSDGEGNALGWRLADGQKVRAPTRREIDAQGVLAGKGLELVFLESALEVYLVHVQGSARLRMTDGTILPVGYAGKTEHAYASLGKALIRDGKVPADGMSLAAIKRYFAAHGTELDRYLLENDSYVFFTETAPGPFGSLGARVTPRASIATDKGVFPRGALAFVDARLGGAPFRAFVLDQDTGGAIRSAGRCDIFAGTGPEAERIAGETQSVGRLYYLFSKRSGAGA